MRSFDFSPLYRSTVGFDRLANMLESVSRVDASAASYPPYNIEQSSENDYRITMAVAGFSDADLTVELKDGTLTVTGKRPEQEPRGRVLHQGIAGRSFERRFQLAEYMEVTGAKLEHGLLHIDVVRIIPEEKKPRRIAIQAAGEQPQPKVIDTTARAA